MLSKTCASDCREVLCISTTMEDAKVTSEGFLLPLLVTRGEGAAEGSGTHRTRNCQPFPGKNSQKHRSSGQAIAVTLGQGGVAGLSARRL